MRNYVKSLISSNKFCSPGSRNGFYSRANKICSLKPPPIRFREIKNCKQIANGSHICLHLSSRARSGDWKNCSLRYLTPFVHITMDRLFASSAPSSGGRPLLHRADEVWELHRPICRQRFWPLPKCTFQNRDLARTRTWNPLIRSQMPYPLGHKTPIFFRKRVSTDDRARKNSPINFEIVAFRLQGVRSWLLENRLVNRSRQGSNHGRSWEL